MRLFIKFEPKILVLCVHYGWLSSGCCWPLLKYFGCRAVNKYFFSTICSIQMVVFWFLSDEADKDSRIPAINQIMCVLFSKNVIICCFCCCCFYCFGANSLNKFCSIKYFVVSWIYYMYVNVVAVNRLIVVDFFSCFFSSFFSSSFVAWKW